MRVLFQIRTDGSVTKDGFYLDDVKITDQALSQQAKNQLGVIKKKNPQARIRNQLIQKGKAC